MDKKYCSFESINWSRSLIGPFLEEGGPIAIHICMETDQSIYLERRFVYFQGVAGYFLLPWES